MKLPKHPYRNLKGYYTVITCYYDGHTDTRDFLTLKESIREWEFRVNLFQALKPHTATVRILRISALHILDVTPGKNDHETTS